MRKDQILERQLEEIKVSSTIANLHAKLTRIEQENSELRREREEALTGWEAADAQISIEAGDVTRLTKDRDELRALLELKTSQFQYEAEQNALLRSSLQSAKEQYRKGMERACCLIEQFVAKTCQSGHLLKVRDQIRAELSKEEGNENTRTKD